MRLLTIVAALIAASIAHGQDVIGRVQLVKPPEARESLSIAVGSEGVVEVQASPRGRYIECNAGANAVYELKPENGVARVLIIAKSPGELCLVFADAEADGPIVLEKVTVTIVGDGGTDPVRDPDEEFLDSLLEAYDAEPNAELVTKLAAVYEAAIWGVSANQTQTVGQLFADLGTKARERGVEAALPRVQQVISKMMTRRIGDPGTTPDRVLPNITATVLRDLANVLREIGKDG